MIKMVSRGSICSGRPGAKLGQGEDTVSLLKIEIVFFVLILKVVCACKKKDTSKM